MVMNIVGLKRNGSLDYVLIRNLELASQRDALILHFKAPLSLTVFGRILPN